MSDLIITEGGESYIKLSALYEKEMKPAIMAPFLGVMIPVIVRRLTFAQIRSCGDFSLIETVSDVMSKKKKASVQQMISYAELQYEIVKKTLVNPTYDELMSLNEFDILRVEAEKELKEIDKLIDELPVGPKRDKLQNEYNVLKMNSQFLLPIDFIGYIMSYALSLDDSDIKLVSEDMLFEAAVRAHEGKGSPSDHLPGNFTEFNKVDINNRALVIYSQRIKEKNGNTSRRG